MLLEGIFLPLTTPFYPDGRVYVRKLEHNVDRYSRTPAAGLLVLGSAGEAEGLTDAETHEVLAVAANAAAPGKVLLAGCTQASVAAALAQAEMAAKAGYDALVLRGPEFTAEEALHAETMTFFEAVADRAPLPVLLATDASRRLSVAAMVELAGHPNVIGAVDEEGSLGRLGELMRRTAGISREVTVTTIFAAATGRMLRESVATEPGGFISAESLSGSAESQSGGVALAVAPPKPALKTRQKRVGFQVLCGSTARMLEAWGAGAAGALPRLGAAAPQACCEVWQAFRDDDQPLAQEKQERVRAAGRRMEGWAGIAAMKHGCDLNGYFGGRPRLPLLALNEDGREAVERELSGLRN